MPFVSVPMHIYNHLSAAVPPSELEVTSSSEKAAGLEEWYTMRLDHLTDLNE